MLITWWAHSNCIDCWCLEACFHLLLIYKSSVETFELLKSNEYLLKTENSDTLLVGPDEKRIMASVEKTRANHLRRCAAAKLIQCAWRVYHFKRLMEIAAQKVDNTNGKKQRRLTLFKHLHRLRESHILERDFSDALWQWRQVKHSTNNVDTSLGIMDLFIKINSFFIELT